MKTVVTFKGRNFYMPAGIRRPRSKGGHFNLIGQDVAGFDVQTFWQPPCGLKPYPVEQKGGFRARLKMRRLLKKIYDSWAHVGEKEPVSEILNGDVLPSGLAARNGSFM